MEKLKVNISLNLDDKSRQEFTKSTLKLINSNPDLKEYIYKLTKSEDVIKRSSVNIQRYYESIKPCKDCKGYYECKKKEDKGLISYLKYNEDLDRLEDEFCNCKYLNDIYKILNNLVYSNFDWKDLYDVYIKCYELLSSDDKGTNSFKNIGKKVLKTCLNYKIDSLNKGLFITSENNNGDNLLKFITFHLIKNNKKVALVNCNYLFSNLASMNKDIKDSATNSFNKIRNADILILIGLGMEYKNKLNIDSNIVPLLFDRNKVGKLTLASSFFSKEDLISAYYTYKNDPNKKLFASALENLFSFEILNDFPRFN